MTADKGVRKPDDWMRMRVSSGEDGPLFLKDSAESSEISCSQEYVWMEAGVSQWSFFHRTASPFSGRSPEAMTVMVNGKHFEIAADTTVADLIEVQPQENVFVNARWSVIWRLRNC